MISCNSLRLYSLPQLNIEMSPDWCPWHQRQFPLKRQKIILLSAIANSLFVRIVRTKNHFPMRGIEWSKALAGAPRPTGVVAPQITIILRCYWVQGQIIAHALLFMSQGLPPLRLSDCLQLTTNQRYWPDRQTVSLKAHGPPVPL